MCARVRVCVCACARMCGEGAASAMGKERRPRAVRGYRSRMVRSRPVVPQCGTPRQLQAPLRYLLPGLRDRKEQTRGRLQVKSVTDLCILRVLQSFLRLIPGQGDRRRPPSDFGRQVGQLIGRRGTPGVRTHRAVLGGRGPGPLGQGQAGAGPSGALKSRHSSCLIPLPLCQRPGPADTQEKDIHGSSLLSPAAWPDGPPSFAGSVPHPPVVPGWLLRCPVRRGPQLGPLSLAPGSLLSLCCVLQLVQNPTLERSRAALGTNPPSSGTTRSAAR